MVVFLVVVARFLVVPVVLRAAGFRVFVAVLVANVRAARALGVTSFPPWIVNCDNARVRFACCLGARSAARRSAL